MRAINSGKEVTSERKIDRKEASLFRMTGWKSGATLDYVNWASWSVAFRELI